MTLRIHSSKKGKGWNCLRTPVSASALADGEESLDTAFALHRHLVECAVCRKKTDETRDLVLALDSLPRIEVLPEVRNQLLAAIRSRVELPPCLPQNRRRVRHLRLLGFPLTGGLLLYPLWRALGGFPWETAPFSLEPGFAPSLFHQAVRAITLLARGAVEGLRQFPLGTPEAPSFPLGSGGFHPAWIPILLLAATFLGLFAMTAPLFRRGLLVFLDLQERR